jgi:hypothetical protein
MHKYLAVLQQLLLSNNLHTKFGHHPPTTVLVKQHASPFGSFTSAQDEKILPSDCRLRARKIPEQCDGTRSQIHPKESASLAVLQELSHGERTLEGIEAINMIRKGQVKKLAGSDVQGQAKFVASLFGIAA